MFENLIRNLKAAQGMALCQNLTKFEIHLQIFFEAIEMSLMA